MWACKTKVGTFYIVPREDSYEIMFRDDGLGQYATPQQAVDDLVGGHTFSAGPGIDTSKLGIPDDLGEWDEL